MKTKSKPKQRTNWKQRALHCEAVIAIHSQLETISAEKRREYLQRAEAAENRALAAEKRNALLLEERAELVQCSYCDEKFSRFADNMLHVCDSRKCVDRYYAEYSKRAASTHWQRFKSFLTNWQVELLTIAAVVTVLFAYVAFIYRNGVR